MLLGVARGSLGWGYVGGCAEVGLFGCFSGWFVVPGHGVVVRGYVVVLLGTIVGFQGPGCRVEDVHRGFGIQGR